jgi:replication factor C small subunit
MNVNDYLLTEKYRPQTIDECILPDSTRATLESFVVNGKIPNLLFCGSAGIGKTTVAHALGRQLGYDVLFVNASNEGRSIDTLRGLITDFASSMSLYANHKLVILDEFDGTGAVVQDALRAFVELYSGTCSFILTCNYKHKLIDAIHSRFSEVNFSIPADQKSKVAVAFMKRVVAILEKENITFDKTAVAELVKKYFPDFRRTLTELQRYTSDGTFTIEELKNLDLDVNGIIALIKDKKFSEMITAVEKSSTIDITAVANELYDNADKFCDANNKPVLIKILSDYIDKGTRTTNPKITIMAMYAEIMANI